MQRPPIYLDHNATTPILPEAADAVRDCLGGVHANASSQHAAGRTARRRLEAAKERIAQLLRAGTGGQQPDRLLLTSGGTESNNLALRSCCRPGHGELGRDELGRGERHLIISSIEHPSVDATADQLREEGVAVDRLPVDSRGVVMVDRLPGLLRPSTRLVSVMLANNETGAIQPIEEITRCCAERGVPVHTDATQAVGKVSIEFRSLGVHFLTFTAHKFHGPAGVGGLLVRGDMAPLAGFGGQAGAERPGTPAVALAVGMQAALEAWHAESAERQTRLRGLRDRFEQLVTRDAAPVEVVAAAAPRLPHTANVAFLGIDRQALVMALDRAGVECSTGSACASGSSEPSPPLLAMGLPAETVRSAVRFSLGALTTEAEIDDAAARVAEVCQRLRLHQNR